MQFDNKNIKSISRNIANSATSHNRTAFIMTGGIFMEEIWVDVSGYEGLYQVSNKGMVRSITRIRVDRNGKMYNLLGLILKQNVNVRGYLMIHLTKNNISKPKTIHRLVAIAFVENPNNKRCVNHINGIKIDNRVENLEWNTHSENNHHAYDLGLKKPTWLGKSGIDNNSSKSVLQLSIDGIFLAKFGSAAEASRNTGVGRSYICSCARGIYKTACGFIWKYE